MDEYSSPESLACRFVLYVEDEPLNVMLMQAVLAHRPHYKLIVATDGASAIDAARGIKPDLLLLDINLPDCQGHELLARMRLTRGWKNVPAVAVTGDTSFDIAGSSFCERWIKPVPPPEMLKGLDRFLREEAPPELAYMPGIGNARWNALQRRG